MKFRDFRIGWRLLIQEPAHSLVAIIGLAIGFMVFFLGLSYIYYALHFDRHVPEYQHIFIVKSLPNWEDQRWHENIPTLVKDGLERSGLPLHAARLVVLDTEMRGDGAVQNVKLTTADASLIEVFGIKPVEGDLLVALSRPNALALTVSTARRLFGDTHALGKYVHIKNDTFLVSAIISDTPDNSTVPFSAVTGINTLAWKADERKAILDSWSDLSARLYIKLGANISADQIARRIAEDADRSPLRAQLKAEQLAQLGHDPLYEVKLGALTDSFLDPVVGGGNGSRKGNRTITISVACIALFVLLLAIANYVNLATVRIIARQREIAIRKVLGAPHWRVVMQVLTETILVSLIAAGVGMLLAWLVLPGFSALSGFALESLLTATNFLLGILAVLGFSIVIGLLAGFYPALMTAKIRPSAILAGRGSSVSTHGMWLRRSLTVFQFAVGMFFISMALTMSGQLQHISRLNFGFDPDKFLSIEMPYGLEQANAKSFSDAVRRLPSVVKTTASTVAIGQADFWNVDITMPDARVIKLDKTLVSPDYFNVYEIAPLAGRLFDAKIDNVDNPSVVVIDALAVTRLGFSSPTAAVGQFIKVKDKPLQIIGVNQPVRTQSLLMDAAPRVFMLSLETPSLSVKFEGDPAIVSAAITHLWAQHFPQNILQIKPVRNLLERGPRQIEPMLIIVSIVMCIVISLAFVGMYILSAYSLQRRSKEIVLRKLYGAMGRDIAQLLSYEFIVLIVVSALLGLPVAYVMGESLLDEFAERAAIGPWAVLAALVSASIVAMISTIRHTRVAMHMSPASALRG
ncbi:putative ABC transport system permease protein [Undibacterium sp. GrIS 1.8]|uniref:ABC transporter permease n=1 Tax=Undibacterium sp. GrIS 1.8 TaxID=3143934 RepID=UPI0033966FA3